MQGLICIGISWMAAFICIRYMKRAQPENGIYPVWAICVCILLTLFLISYEFLWRVH